MTIPFWSNPDIADDFSEAAPLNPWEVVWFGGVRAPGIATVRTKRAHRIDVRVSPGDSAAQIPNLGPVPAEVDITLRIWTADHWKRWGDLHAQVFKKHVSSGLPPEPRAPTASPNSAVDTAIAQKQFEKAMQDWEQAATAAAARIANQEAIEVDHPALQLLGIHSLYCTEMGIPEFHETPGVAVIAIRFVEFRPVRGVSGVHQPTKAETSLENINYTRDYSGQSTIDLVPSHNVSVTGP